MAGMSLGEPEMPTGVVMVCISPELRVVAHAADFERSAPGGFRLVEAQTSRCRRLLHHAVIDKLAHPVLGEVMDPYDAEKVVRGLCDKRGYRIHTIVIGDQDA